VRPKERHAPDERAPRGGFGGGGDVVGRTSEISRDAKDVRRTIFFDEESPPLSVVLPGWLISAVEDVVRRGGIAIHPDEAGGPGVRGLSARIGLGRESVRCPLFGSDDVRERPDTLLSSTVSRRFSSILGSNTILSTVDRWEGNPPYFRHDMLCSWRKTYMSTRNCAASLCKIIHGQINKMKSRAVLCWHVPAGK
jgi:hypothetical protein